jgi:hypothetical protein
MGTIKKSTPKMGLCLYAQANMQSRLSLLHPKTQEQLILGHSHHIRNGGQYKSRNSKAHLGRATFEHKKSTTSLFLIKGKLKGTKVHYYYYKIQSTGQK